MSLVSWDEQNRRLTVAPRLVEGPDWAKATNVRCGASVCDVKARLRRDALELVVWCRIGPPVWVDAAPWFPEAPSSAEVDGQVVTPQLSPEDGGVRAGISFLAGAEHEVRFSR